MPGLVVRSLGAGAEQIPRVGQPRRKRVSSYHYQLVTVALPQALPDRGRCSREERQTSTMILLCRLRVCSAQSLYRGRKRYTSQTSILTLPRRRVLRRGPTSGLLQLWGHLPSQGLAITRTILLLRRGRTSARRRPFDRGRTPEHFCLFVVFFCAICCCKVYRELNYSAPPWHLCLFFAVYCCCKVYRNLNYSAPPCVGSFLLS
jgi:hypothetical protein